MLNTFQTDCAQYNPHLNYLKMHILLKISLATLCKWMKKLVALMSNDFEMDTKLDKMRIIDIPFNRDLENVMNAIRILMDNLCDIEQVCLRYIEVRFVEKYFKENLLKPSQYELFINFATACMNYAELTQIKDFIVNNNNCFVAAGGVPGIPSAKVANVFSYFQCTDSIIKQKHLWMELNQTEKYKTNVKLILNVIYMTTGLLLTNTHFLNKYENVDLFKSTELNKTSIELYRQAVFVAKFVESERETGNTLNIGYTRLQVCS